MPPAIGSRLAVHDLWDRWRDRNRPNCRSFLGHAEPINRTVVNLSQPSPANKEHSSTSGAAPAAVNGRGHIEFNEKAADDARTRVTAFFGKWLAENNP